MARKLDPELEEFRSLLETPSEFHDGFTWQSFIGAVFISLIMVPGSIYMGLVAGIGIGGAAQWVTVILFIEVARRARRTLNRAEIFILFYLSAGAMASPFSGLLYQQFFVQSDAARAAGIADLLPWWYAPKDPEVLASRTFLRIEWLPIIGLGIFQLVVSRISTLVLGYGLFRLTSDIEKLPFPMAPVAAQGIIAMADDASGKDPEENWRWRVFSLGSGLGMIFGFIYTGIPTITGALLTTPMQPLPIPFLDWTHKTGSFLPAVATGLSFDLGNLITGMVLPFWAMLGSFIGLVVTMVLNPFLYTKGMLPSWVLGDNTLQTLFKNNIDFYFSFQIGIAVALAVAGLVQVFSGMKEMKRKKQEERLILAEQEREKQRNRGDIKVYWIIGVYILFTMFYILLSGWLIKWHRGVMAVLIFFGFVYTPLMNYVRARLEGMAGQVVDIPMIKEAAFILSGYKGVAIWFLPIPLSNFSSEAVFYRQAELVGTKFKSIWKSEVCLAPIILISSIFFANFIWRMSAVPSPTFPFAEKMWEFQAMNRCIMLTSTLKSGFSQFEEALKWPVLLFGTVFAGALFPILYFLNLPIMLVYGLVRGLGQTLPHSVIPQFIGALIGRFYFQKRMGKQWRKIIPVVAAGFGCGVGLITMFGVGVTFLAKSVTQLPF